MLRKLRLPLFAVTANQTCLCHKDHPLDPYGDHLFSCSKSPKTHASNTIRDALFSVLQELAPHSKHVRSPHDIHVEPLNLLPAYPSNIRPADVGIKLIPAENKQEYKYIAIDVTIPPPTVCGSHSPPTDLSDLQNLADLASRTHQLVARGKLTKDPVAASLMNQNKIVLVPFTVDHLGGIGSFASTLLFCYNSLGIAVALMLGRADNQVVTNRYKPLHG